MRPVAGDRSPRILFVGNAQTAEMRPLVPALRRIEPAAEFRSVANIPAADDIARQADWFPDLAVVCQNRSDEFSQTEVDRLLSLFPLARWVCCFGVWCESDGRNRSIWPTAARVPARCALPRLRRELAVIRGEISPLPLTASRDEAFGFDSPGDVLPAESRRTVCVTSPDRELRDWVVDLLHTAGHHTVDRLDDGPVDVLVRDVDPWTPETASELRDLCRQYPDLAVVSLMTFAHPEEIRAAAVSGTDRVVAKLTSHTELLDAVATATPHRKSPTT